MKPKLDRFLKKMYSRSHTDESMPEDWFIVDSSGERTEALDYKMQITPQANSSRQFEIRKNDYSNKYNFLANMGGDEARRDGTHEGAAKFVMENHPLSGQIVSFRESLLAFMNEPIVENLTPIDMFFACTNFGMRQDKGFGEFVTNPLLLQGPSANDLFEEVLNSVYGNYVYSTELEKGRKGVLRKEFNDLEPACRTIGKVYKRLKSGKENFVHVYFSQNSNSRVKDYTVSNLYKRSFENEKDVCKRDGANADGAVYGKALFGLANEIKIKEGTWTIGSRDEQNAISRIKSPVTFRVLYDTVYMFLDFDYCDEQRMASYAMLAGKPITFTAKNGQKEFSIPLPPNPPEGTLIDVYHDIFEKFVQFVEEKGLDQPESSSGKQQSSWNKGSHGSYKHDNTQNTTHKNQKHSNKIVIKEGKKL